MAEEPLDLGLSDDDYWSNPFKTRGDIESKLMTKGTEALIVGAPGTVTLQNHDTLPVVVIRTAPLDRMARLGFRQNAILTAVDLSTNTTFAYMAIVADIVEPPPYNGPPLSGMGGEAFELEAKKQLTLPWGPTSFLIGILLRDQVSNRVRVDVKRGGYEDPAVIEYLKSREKTSEPPPPWPEPGIPTIGPQDIRIVSFPYYRELTTSPPIPAEPGIALKVDRVVPITENTKSIIRGSFRLPIRAGDIVTGLPRPNPDMGEPHTAIVSITLVLTGSDRPVPIVLPLKIPTFDRVEKNTAVTVVTGYFTFDLCKLKNIAGVEQTYFIYVFSGELMLGPIPMAFVR